MKTKITLLSIAALSGAFLFAQVHAGASTLPVNSSINSVNPNRGFADPSGLYAPSSKTYYAYTTSYNKGNALFAPAVSKDGLHYTDTNRSALTNLPSWSTGQKLWAPDVVYNPTTKKYVMTYTTEDAKSGNVTNTMSIAVATSSNPASGFVSSEQGLYRAYNTTVYNGQNRGIDYIDSSIFVDSDGKAYLLAKKEGLAKDQSYNVQIVACQLDATWTKFATGSTEKVLLNKGNASINKGILPNDTSSKLVEAPYMAKAPDGTYVLFYAERPNNELAKANDPLSGTYTTAWATSTSATGNFAQQGVLLDRLNSGLSAPGGLQLEKDANGNLRALFMSAMTTSKTLAYGKGEVVTDADYAKNSLILGGAVYPNGKYYSNPWQLDETGFYWTGHTPSLGNGQSSLPIYFLKNTKTGQQLYTESSSEKNNLTKAGWTYGGISWYAPISGKPVYRMYDTKRGGTHYYTTDPNQVKKLEGMGFQIDFGGKPAFYSGGSKELNVIHKNATGKQTLTYNISLSDSATTSLLKSGWIANSVDAVVTKNSGQKSVDPYTLLFGVK